MTAHRDAGSERDLVSPLADPGTRLAAVTLDALIPLAPQLAVLLLGLVVSSGPAIVASTWVGWAAFVVVLGVDLWLLHRYGQTLGKRIMGVRIVRTDGARASLARIVFRRTLLPIALGWVPVAGWLFSIADTFSIFAADRRTLHDRMADTIVIDVRAAIAKPPLADVFT